MGTRKILIISVVVITISIITVMSFTNAASTDIKPTLQNYNKQCDHSLHVKMFDPQIGPKYIIGSGYKIIPVNPATTDVLVNPCGLQILGS
ncbi:MAG TPA: hypothetical protein VI278_16055 [Nitrososphaeraceae archaeon]|jgi:hypothetical protein